MTLLIARRCATHALGAALLVAASSSRVGAQLGATHVDDAAPMPRGMLRLRAVTAFTRFDSRFGAAGRTALGDELSADPLGTVQFPLLAPLQASIQSLAADAHTPLSLGRLVTRGDARIVTVPFALDYGITRRLSIGIVVPVVQTRRTITLGVNALSGAPANVGFVPPSQRLNAATTNLAAANSFKDGADQLTALIARCQSAPSMPECAGVVADPAGAAAAAALALRFAGAARALGTDTSQARLAPRANGNFAVEIEQQRVALNQRLRALLGASGPQATPVYFAPTDFSYVDLQGRDGQQGLLQSRFGGGLDSLRTTERVGVGDISIGAQYLVFDRFQTDSLPARGVQSRLSVGGAVRFATGRPDTATNLVAIGTGEGAALELRSAADVIRGRVGATLAGRFVRSFARPVYTPIYGDADAGFPIPVFGSRRRTGGDVMALDLTPRYLLNEIFALDAHYGVERLGAPAYDLAGTDAPIGCIDFCTAAPIHGSARTSHRLGGGLRYSTVDAYARGRARYPFEASYTHLTTVSGSVGAPRLSREQIQVRLFYRLSGR